MKELTVEFTARFKAIIQVEDDASDEDIHDAICDVDVPENDQCKYIPDTFEPNDPEE